MVETPYETPFFSFLREAPLELYVWRPRQVGATKRKNNKEAGKKQGKTSLFSLPLLCSYSVLRKHRFVRKTCVFLLFVFFVTKQLSSSEGALCFFTFFHSFLRKNFLVPLTGRCWVASFSLVFCIQGMKRGLCGVLGGRARKAFFICALI